MYFEATRVRERSVVGNDWRTRGQIVRRNTHARRPRLNPPHSTWRPRGVLINLQRCRFFCGCREAVDERIEARRSYFGKSGASPPSCLLHACAAPTTRLQLPPVTLSGPF